MGVRAIVAASVVVVVVGAVLFVDAVRDPGAPARQSVSQSIEASPELPADPDVVVTFKAGATDEVIDQFFLDGVDIIPHRTVSMDWEANRALLHWAPETGEDLRAAAVLLLRNAYPVEKVERIR